MSAGQRFMTDLLVSSLMADGGLEFAMEEAIKKEKEAFEDKKVGFLYMKILIKFLYENIFFICNRHFEFWLYYLLFNFFTSFCKVT